MASKRTLWGIFYSKRWEDGSKKFPLRMKTIRVQNGFLRGISKVFPQAPRPWLKEMIDLNRQFRKEDIFMSNKAHKSVLYVISYQRNEYWNHTVRPLFLVAWLKLKRQKNTQSWQRCEKKSQLSYSVAGDINW